jgi:dihydropteroate synthase
MSTLLAGILNLTPDSFSDGGRFAGPSAVLQAQNLFNDGASIVDIGAEATNPWAKPVSVDEEWSRLERVVRELLPSKPDFSFSIDTRRPEIVERAAKYGKFYVNDISTFINPRLIEITQHLGLRAIVSHLPLAARGDVAKAHAEFHLDDMNQVADELLLQREQLIGAGVPAEDIILDPGIGFGKSMALNWQLLEFSAALPAMAVMIGFSRKRFLSTDRVTGEAIKGLDKLSLEVNLDAARTAIAAAPMSSSLYLRVHEPALYVKLLS